MILCNNMYENRPTIRRYGRLIRKDQRGRRTPGGGRVRPGAGARFLGLENKVNRTRTSQNQAEHYPKWLGGAAAGVPRGSRGGKAASVRVECPFDGLGQVGAAGKSRTDSRSQWAAWQASAPKHWWGRRSRSKEGGQGVVESENGPEVGCGRTKQNEPEQSRTNLGFGSNPALRGEKASMEMSGRVRKERHGRVRKSSLRGGNN
jgi:hypothetical protein